MSEAHVFRAAAQSYLPQVVLLPEKFYAHGDWPAQGAPPFFVFSLNCYRIDCVRM
ncbi:hypothetical protein COCNU_02G007860 [Cocos nucifera]|uniref:Uncharacterized protein n=1 Tax=Cocos nucifera TaxID=13894 RepID=A0A8K0HYY5_COCNU|nr:hypothetical protein COCNU_02G007860 [Cocos nucifera]